EAEHPLTLTPPAKDIAGAGGSGFPAQKNEAEYTLTLTPPAKDMAGGNGLPAQKNETEHPLFWAHRGKDVDGTEVYSPVQLSKKDEFYEYDSEVGTINMMKMKQIENDLRLFSVRKVFHGDTHLSKFTGRDIKNRTQTNKISHNAASFEYQFNSWNGNHSVRVLVQKNEHIKLTPSDEQTSGMLSKKITDLTGFHAKTIEPYQRDEEQRGHQRQHWVKETEDEQ
ncbi:hypothetical protein QCA75_004791, partial [Salmonella enterica]|nr:hypothetical protein [Salmonella enterica]